MKALKSIVAALVTITGCGNAHRNFSGPVVQPLWIIPNLGITQEPLLREGVAYVFGHAPGAGRDQRRLHAFDLATRKQLWVSNFVPVDKIKYIAGARLFVVDDRGIGHTLDRKTGQEVAAAAPTNMVKATVADGVVYANWSDGSVTASRGMETLWTAKTPTQPNSFVEPAVSAGSVYVFGDFEARETKLSSGAGIYAFDIQDGTLRWKFETQGEYLRTCLLEADAGAVYASIEGREKRSVFALDAATGKQKWTVQTGARFLYDRPLLLDPSTVLFFDYPSGPGGTLAEKGYVIRAVRSATGEPLWQSSTPWKYGGWRILNSALYFSDREDHSWTGMWMYPNTHGAQDSWLTRVDPRTGREVWRSQVVKGGDFTGPAFGEGLVVVGCAPWAKESKPAGLYAYRP